MVLDFVALGRLSPAREAHLREMSIRIADSDGLWEIELPVDGAVAESLRVQMARLGHESQRYQTTVERIAATFSRSVVEVLDPDLRPPTDAQVSFALAIAKELNVNLPGEALIFRCAMGEFLDRYSTLFYSRRNRTQAD